MFFSIGLGLGVSRWRLHIRELHLLYCRMCLCSKESSRTCFPAPVGPTLTTECWWTLSEKTARFVIYRRQSGSSRKSFKYVLDSELIVVHSAIFQLIVNFPIINCTLKGDHFDLSCTYLLFPGLRDDDCQTWFYDSWRSARREDNGVQGK